MGARAIGLATTVALGLWAMPRAADATWSIAAVDARTQEVGVAVASCVEAPFGTTILPEVAALAPGVGALAAQALFVQARRDMALALLQMGLSPQAVIDVTIAMDSGADNRQYGVVVLSGQSAAFTGANAEDWAGDRPGVGVTVQGNILYGPEVVDDALAAFEAQAPRCPWTLADRLMVALEAGAAQGGDNRCSKAQSALAATIQVARPGDEEGGFYLDIRIPSQPMDGDNPVQLLRAAYDGWRADNPPDDAACDAGTSSGGVSGSSGPGPMGGDGSGAATDDGDEPPAPPPGSSTGSASPGSSSGTSPGQADGGSGCGCTAASPWSSGPWLLALLALARCRRRPATFRAT